MHRVSFPWLLDVVAAIDNLEKVEPTSLDVDNWYPLFNAKNQIESVFNKSLYGQYLVVSREKASLLFDTISKIIGDSPNSDKSVDDFEIWNLKYQKNQFRTVFLSEVSTFPCFLVSRKEGYDTNILIDEGIRLFPSSLAQKVPEAIVDSLEAGKALAFELATACGFHVFRVTESVLKRYWDVVSNGSARPSPETIGTFANELDKQMLKDAKIIESLKQLAKLHRNPLIHPEAILTVEEAIDTLGIARSVIGAMLRVLPDVPPTTGAVVPVVASP